MWSQALLERSAYAIQLSYTWLRTSWRGVVYVQHGPIDLPYVTLLESGRGDGERGVSHRSRPTLLSDSSNLFQCSLLL